MFGLNKHFIFNYYLRYLLQSFVFFALGAFVVHYLLYPLLSVCRFSGSKKQFSFLCGAERLTAAQLGHNSWLLDLPVSSLIPFLFFRVLTSCRSCSNSLACAAFVSTRISMLTASSANGPPCAEALLVAAAAILSSYPAIESIIPFNPTGRLSFMGMASPAPPKGWSTTSRAFSPRCFAAYAAQNFFFHSVQVCSCAGSFSHPRVSASYLFDAMRAWRAGA